MAAYSTNVIAWTATAQKAVATGSKPFRYLLVRGI
jgi:hypothetical protein